MSAPTRLRPRRVALVLLALGLAGLAHAAQASKARTGKKVPPTSVRFIDGPSSESPAIREKRLRRECLGRANAGACLGHTR